MDCINEARGMTEYREVEAGLMHLTSAPFDCTTLLASAALAA